MDTKSKTVPLLISSTDRSFLISVHEFIVSEKERLCSSAEEPDEQQYIIYSSAFNKVIEHATAYKMILTSIKKEYDDFIGAVKRNDRKAKLAQSNLKAKIAQPASLKYFQMRAAQLQERIAVIERDTAEIQAELKMLQEARIDRRDPQEFLDDQANNPLKQIPGLTLSESLDPAALDKHLEMLEKKRADLLNKKKSQYVSVQVKTDLDIRLKAILNQRDELALENGKLQLRYKQLAFLNESISCWATSANCPSLSEFISSELEHVSEMKVCEADSYGNNTDVSEEDDPNKAQESELLVEYIERFSELFKAGEYEAAAYHAARSPHGVLRNMETIERFKSVTVYEGDLPPVLLFFQALMILAKPGKHLPGEMLSLEAVQCALQHGCVQLLTFWVTQHRLTYSEELGDVICNHGDKDPRVADTCLALAHMVYTACGVLRKAALSMCRRGLTSCAVELIHNNTDFTIGECMFVLRGCPSLALLQDLTQPYADKPALLTVGFLCHSLLNSDLEDLAFQLLQKIHADGQGALERTILDDIMCSAESWSEIATRCELKKPQLAQEIMSTLLSQPGAMCLPHEQESAKLMEHVFL